jgi:hypothetical protein
MKAVITGHVKGLGSAISSILTDRNFHVKGYDISQGSDVNDSDVCEQILQDCKDADIFVNNAPANQCQLLHKVFESWIGQDKTIINVSSAATFLKHTDLPEDITAYTTEKKLLDYLITVKRSQHSLPYVMNVRPSWFHSELVQRFDADKMQPQDIAEVIVALYDFRSRIKILDIVLSK